MRPPLTDPDSPSVLSAQSGEVPLPNLDGQALLFGADPTLYVIEVDAGDDYAPLTEPT